MDVTPFTNDDLEHVRKLSKEATITVMISPSVMRALLRRLEVAEKCAELFANSCCVEDDIVKAWHDAAGK